MFDLNNIWNKTNDNSLSSIRELYMDFKANVSMVDIFLEYEYGFYQDTEIVIFDTETNGFRDEIIEIGWVIVKNNMVKNKNGEFYPYSYYLENNGERKWEMDSFSYFVYPQSGESKTEEVTNISMEMIENWLSPYAKEWEKTFENIVDALDAFMDYVWDRPMVAHNAGFDCWIISWTLSTFYADFDKALKNPNHPITIEKLSNFLQLPVIDTLDIAKKIMHVKGIENHKNNSLSRYFWLVPNESMLHRACYDSFFTARVFYGLYEYYGETVNNSILRDII